MEKERRLREKMKVREMLERKAMEKEESASESQDVKAGFYSMGSDGYQNVGVCRRACVSGV